MVNEISVLEGYSRVRFAYFKWQRHSALLVNAALAIGMACVTGLLAQVKFYLPWTPVPVVATQFGVIFSAILLGRSWGGISMIIYVLLGIAGVPWFTGMKGGFAFLLGPTFGYTIGFILASFFIGYFVDRFIESRKTIALFGLIVFSQLVIVYIPGLIQLYLFMSVIKKESIGLIQLLWMGYIPFIIGDLIKSLACSMLAKAALPMENFGK